MKLFNWIRGGVVRLHVLAGLLLICFPVLSAEAELGVGDVFPELAGFELEGEAPPSLLGRVVVVDFWASWCGPCRQTFPLMEELHHRFSKQGLLILAINEDKSPVAMNEFLKQYPVNFKVVRDLKKKLAARVSVPALPTSYLLDPTGRIRLVQSGQQIVQNRKKFIREVETLVEQYPQHPR